MPLLTTGDLDLIPPIIFGDTNATTLSIKLSSNKEPKRILPPSTKTDVIFLSPRYLEVLTKSTLSFLPGILTTLAPFLLRASQASLLAFATIINVSPSCFKIFEFIY